MFTFFGTQPTHISEKVMWFEFFSCSFSATTLGLKTEICGRKQLRKNKTRKRGLFANAFHQISKQNAKKDSCFYLILSNLKKCCKKFVILGSFLKKTERGHHEFNHF